MRFCEEDGVMDLPLNSGSQWQMKVYRGYLLLLGGGWNQVLL